MLIELWLNLEYMRRWLFIYLITSEWISLQRKVYFNIKIQDRSEIHSEKIKQIKSHLLWIYSRFNENSVLKFFYRIYIVSNVMHVTFFIDDLFFSPIKPVLKFLNIMSDEADGAFFLDATFFFSIFFFASSVHWWRHKLLATCWRHGSFFVDTMRWVQKVLVELSKSIQLKNK